MELTHYQGLPLGSSAPAFSLPGVDGKTYSLDSFREKPILVVAFWCNHCPYVQAWEDRTVATQADYGRKGVQFVLINSNDEAEYPEDDFSHMVERAKRKGYNFPYLRDESQKVVEAYGGVCTPDFFVFDAERKLRYRGKLDDSKDPGGVKRRIMREVLDALLAGREVPTTFVPPMGCSIKWKSGHWRSS
jgi:peroxiredoxin